MVELCESTKLEAQFKAHHATRTISLGADFQLMSKWSLFFPAATVYLVRRKLGNQFPAHRKQGFY